MAFRFNMDRARVAFLHDVVMAAISCMFAPVGTVLGILTLLLLLDSDVKAAFER